MTYKQAVRKFRIETMFMLPFVWAGKLYGKLFPLKTQHDLFFFFPNADIGGSPRVNIDISNCVKDKRPLIIFSKRPKNNQFREEFNIDGVRIIDLQRLIDHKLYHFINFFYRGVIASWIHAATHPVVLGGECLFFYKMLPHLRKNIPCIEICHLGTWLPYTIGHIDRINLRIFSTKKLMEDVARQYDENNIKPALYRRLRFIDNAIDVPVYSELANHSPEVVFIGRGSLQKRIHLIAAIAEKMHDAGDNIHFSFVGDVEKMIDTNNYPYCTFYGNIKDPLQMESIYSHSDVLILTSAFEGLPVVVMSMMAHGRTVLSTAVNGIPDYVEHMSNGLLITETDESKIVEEGIKQLRFLIQHPEVNKALGVKSREIAIEKFSRDVFCKTYREILLEGKGIYFN
jgi:glycosyltransferase involved in cell wall biosynthesis